MEEEVDPGMVRVGGDSGIDWWRAWRSEEVRKRGCFFFWNMARVFFCFLFFSFLHKSWGWRLDLSLSSQEGGTEGPQSFLSPFPLLAASLVFSIIFSLGDPDGESAGVAVIKVKCRCGDALLLTCVVGFFLGQQSRKPEGTFVRKWHRHTQECNGEAKRVYDGAIGSPLGELLSVQINKCY